MGLFKRTKQDKESRSDTSAAEQREDGRKMGKSNPFLAGLRKTRALLTADIGDLLTGRTAIDEAVLEELESRLLMADVGIESTEAILEALRKKIAIDTISSVETLLSHLAEVLQAQLSGLTNDVAQRPEHKPH